MSKLLCENQSVVLGEVWHFVLSMSLCAFREKLEHTPWLLRKTSDRRLAFTHDLPNFR